MEISPWWRGVQSFMGGLQGADNGDVTHYDDKKWEEDDAGYQDGERYGGGVRWRKYGACSWSGQFGQTQNSFTGPTWIFIPSSSSPDIGSCGEKSIIINYVPHSLKWKRLVRLNEQTFCSELFKDSSRVPCNEWSWLINVRHGQRW